MERGKQCSINQPHLGKYRSILSCHPILKYITIEFGTLSVRTERQQLYDQLQIIKPRPDFLEHQHYATILQRIQGLCYLLYMKQNVKFSYRHQAAPCKLYISKKRICCNMATASGGDLRSQQVTRASPTCYQNGGCAPTPLNPGKRTVCYIELAGCGRRPQHGLRPAGSQASPADGAEAAPPGD